MPDKKGSTGYTNKQQAALYFGRKRRRGGGVVNPSLQLSSRTVDEDASVGDVIGALSVDFGSGTYTFSITADPDSKFSITGSNLKVGAALNYEVAQSHLVTIEADNGVDPVVSRTFTITVANVFEVTLGALSLSSLSVDDAAAAGTVIGSITGKSSGSTVTMTNDGGGHFSLSGNNVITTSTPVDIDDVSYSITLRETHSDAGNSPRDNNITITVSPPGSFLLLDDGASFLLLDNGTDRLLLDGPPSGTPSSLTTTGGENLTDNDHAQLTTTGI